eukprot:6394946-Amphidinium_carterae.1
MLGSLRSLGLLDYVWRTSKHKAAHPTMLWVDIPDVHLGTLFDRCWMLVGVVPEGTDEAAEA